MAKKTGKRRLCKKCWTKKKLGKKEAFGLKAFVLRLLPIFEEKIHSFEEGDIVFGKICDSDRDGDFSIT